MSFAEPLWLLALLTLPALAAWELLAVRSDERRIARLVARPLWDRVLSRPPRAWRWIRLGSLILGAAGVVLALARPQWGSVREAVEREGVDVVLVLDTSGSMATEDVSPNRFFLARAALSSLVERLDEDRFALVTFEAEAYPLVPLTLDADAVVLFLETLEPGFVPAPGSSLGAGLARGLEMFVDRERKNKVMVLVSDGEDLEGEVEEAVQQARSAGVVVHTVGVGTEKGEPVPDFDREGRRVGFKKDEAGTVVVSRLNPAVLQAIARGTGGQSFRITTSDTSLTGLVSAIQGMEEKALAKEFSYRKKERFQIPLGISLGVLAFGLLLPLPLPWRRRRAAALVLGALLAWPGAAGAQESAGSHVVDEVLLRPRRLTAEGRGQYERGNHPKALEAFDAAARTRPADPVLRFNMADALYKSGQLEQAEPLYQALAEKPDSPLAAAARFNLGNTRFGKQDFAGAIQAYRDALRLAPGDKDTTWNLELALRALQDQQRQQKREQERQQRDQDQKKDQSQQDRQQKQGSKPPEKPKSKAEQERERFQKEAGMPKERAMQLLDALQQNEKAEQKRLLAAKAAEAKKGKDW